MRVLPIQQPRDGVFAQSLRLWYQRLQRLDFARRHRDARLYLVRVFDLARQPTKGFEIFLVKIRRLSGVVARF